MEDIYLISPGIEPTLYYEHTCSRCDAKIGVKATLALCICPHCNLEEAYTQSPETLIKQYHKNGSMANIKQNKKNEKNKKK